jgi:hypothetical protein
MSKDSGQPGTIPPANARTNYGDGKWWAIPIATLLVAILTVGGQWWNHRSEIDAKMLEIGIGILQTEPNAQTTNLRLWAIDLINKHSDVPLSSRAQSELQKTPLPTVIRLRSWPEALSEKYCDQWRRNSDGSWTQLGAAVLPGNIVLQNNTFGAGTGEARALEQHCGEKH